MVYHVEPGSWQQVPDTIQQNYKESGGSGAPTAVDKEKNETFLGLGGAGVVKWLGWMPADTKGIQPLNIA